MDIFASYGTSLSAEEKGRWFENGDVEFLIARSGNRAYNDMISAQFLAHKHTLDQKDTPEARAAAEDRANKINTLVMSRTILLGWRGVVKKDADGVETAGKLLYKGEELPFSVVNASTVLAHKDFRNWVSGKSDDFRNYLEEVKKEDEKNLAPTSSGVSPGEPV